MTASDDARQAIDTELHPWGVAERVLAAVMPDGRTIAQWLDDRAVALRPEPELDICGPTGTRRQPDLTPLVCTLPAGHTGWHADATSRWSRSVHDPQDGGDQ